MQIPERWTIILITLGRVGMASLFILGGINKLITYADVLQQMSDAGLPFSSVLLPLVILLELTGGLTVAIGRMGAVPSAVALAGFTIATNIVFHDFWNMTGQVSELQLALFFKNVSIAGALILFAGMHSQLRQT
jgi:putative oxidoreductase